MGVYCHRIFMGTTREVWWWSTISRRSYLRLLVPLQIETTMCDTTENYSIFNHVIHLLCFALTLGGKGGSVSNGQVQDYAQEAQMAGVVG